MFKLSRFGISLLEAARDALGHGVTLPPRDDHEEEPGVVGGQWVAELLAAAEEYNAAGSPDDHCWGTKLPQLEATPYGGIASHRTRLSLIKVERQEWYVGFFPPKTAREPNPQPVFSARGENSHFLPPFFNEKGLREVLIGLAEDWLNDYRLWAYRRWFRAVLKLLEEPELLEKVEKIFSEAEEVLEEKRRQFWKKFERPAESPA
jgi:hypothetical protein